VNTPFISLKICGALLESPLRPTATLRNIFSENPPLTKATMMDAG